MMKGRRANAFLALTAQARGRAALPTQVLEKPRVLRVLGLDPGSIRTGWGVIERTGPGARGIAAGVVRVSERAELAERLRLIFAGVKAVIAEHKPDAIAIEDIFFAKYPQAALMLGHARGVALLAAAESGVGVAAYPPSVVKRAVVGSGRADKQQVAMLVGTVLGLMELPGEDATDALAVAVTHLNITRLGA
jgi:crossover junction endodeoxyribonuclease RuvC